MQKQIEPPEWSKRAKYLDHKPDWVDRIPHELASLGEVFFPIPKGMKGWGYAHHIEANRYAYDSEILNAYLEQCWNYGIACSGDLIVIDIDELDYKGEIISSLPPSLYQWTGSGEGIHIFYMCEGVENRRTFYVHICPECETELLYSDFDIEDDDEEVFFCGYCGEEYDKEKFGKRHIGELKADPHGYVVGPGSIHPSGNKYGPMKGDEIIEIDTEKLADAIGDFVKSPKQRSKSRDTNIEYGAEENHDFYNITADDALPELEPETRISHPVHGSSTGSNFMKNEGGYTFVCWRCQYGSSDGCVINGQHYLALEAVGDRYGDHACEEMRSDWDENSKLHYYAWLQAIKKGIIGYRTIPYTVVKGFMVDEGELEESETLYNRTEAENILKYELNCRLAD